MLSRSDVKPVLLLTAAWQHGWGYIWNGWCQAIGQWLRTWYLGFHSSPGRDMFFCVDRCCFCFFFICFVLFSTSYASICPSWKLSVTKWVCVVTYFASLMIKLSLFWVLYIHFFSPFIILSYEITWFNSALSHTRFCSLRLCYSVTGAWDHSLLYWKHLGMCD